MNQMKLTMKTTARLMLAAASLFGINGLAQPGTTTSISFQGALNGTNGQPMPNGNYDLTFRFWDGAAPGGNAVSTNILVPNVPVSRGVASTAIPVQPAWFSTQTLYLGVSINGGAELSPRVLVTAVPYAIGAGSLGPGAANIGTNGFVGIGTSAPKQRLHVNGDYYGMGHLWLYAREGDGQSGTAYIQARDQSGSSRINLRFRTQDTGGYTDVMTLRLNGNVGIGTDNPQERLEVNGTTRTRVLQITGGADLAERLSVTDGNPLDEFSVEPGMVVSIDPTGNRKFKVSDEPYDRKRVGIISGGNGVKPGLVLRDEGNPQADGEQPIALTGQVWCHADATFGAITPGDLLTTSSTPGHAMKVSDDAKARFAVLGQALTGLKEGRGWVQVLVGKQ
jgi:hypothetical protein